MTWTLEQMRESPGVRQAEGRLFELMSAAGKSRFGVARADISCNQPCTQGYGITLELDHPHCDVIYLHELLHGILLEEGYPTARSNERPESEGRTRTILWDFTNTIHHVEIFDRMARYGATLDTYFEYKAGEIIHKIRPIIEADDWNFVRRNMDPLVLFDTFLMGRHGEAVRDVYRRHATRSLDACEEIYREIQRIGCASPEAAMASAQVFQAVMARYCRRYGVPEQYARFWDSINYVPLAHRGDLPDCDWWVTPIEPPGADKPGTDSVSPPAPRTGCWGAIMKLFGWK